MTIEIEYEAEQILDLAYEEIIRRSVKWACSYEACPYEAEVNVLLTDNEGIREINYEYRKIDAPTDVLSFPMIEYESPADFSALEEDPSDYFHPESGELLLGDIVISVETLLSQAKQYGHSAERELAFLVVHSMLHLFGYDHMKQEDAGIMEKKQHEILEQLNILRKER